VEIDKNPLPIVWGNSKGALRRRKGVGKEGGGVGFGQTQGEEVVRLGAENVRGFRVRIG